ncbi:carbohydrate ABC transporter permease [Thermococcus thioreducens]|uniref:Carbohydrate ABC transporter membrane protein 1, CUT1 family n=1 Tax=Thermococcus thioreducens TaxID=277988 RepID=A0A0Q2M129_9EURY|nr:sugar ABC transporter permease [Thermococcus thioreducens]ASJ12173.1 sugar transporter [Thermococcus thioreducens]KQH81570.1 sugar transporter [Thermococcus thioreducens]SEV95545.1 carbohydrate ABC transporter membrane protein 1, CUT1 family [Thermococcus thioreducens]
MFSSFSSFYEKARNKEIVAGLTLISIAVVLNLVFGYFAMFFAFYLSFFKWDYIGEMQFVGLQNFEIVIRDLIRGLHGAPYLLVPFYTGLKNILLYTLIVVPIQTFLAIVLASFANQKIRGQQFFKVSYFLPATTSSVIVALIFIWLFMKNGYINYVLVHVIPGFEPVDWINNKDYLLFAIATVAIWGTSGHFMVSFLAAMQAIPREIYEAAMLDGAGPIRRFFFITIPMLRPMITYVVVMGLIGALQMFDLAWIMAGANGGPGGAGYTVALDIYNEAFTRIRPGVAAAKSWFLFAIIFTTTYLFQKKYGRAMR